MLQAGRAQAAQQVNTLLVHAYWHIGRYIVEFEQKGEDRATYGDKLLETLSKDLTAEYGKGFSRSILFQIRKFYLDFSIIQTLPGQFSIRQTLSDKIEDTSKEMTMTNHL